MPSARSLAPPLQNMTAMLGHILVLGYAYPPCNPLKRHKGLAPLGTLVGAKSAALIITTLAGGISRTAFLGRVLFL